MSQSDLPVWVWDMLIELHDQRDTHPKLLFQSGGMAKPERYDWCSCALLDLVPAEVTAQARVIRDYLQAKQRALTEAKEASTAA